MSVGPCVEKFNVVINEHGRTEKWDFSVLDQKYPYEANLIQKSELTFLAKNWYILWIKHAEINADAHFFQFWLEISFLGKFGPKNQKFQLRLKFCTQTNSNMQNSMVMLIFLLSTGSTLSGQIWSKTSKLSVWAEI